jgi:murein DD-endopeptidase MepM/ murein hydrolase activator NlpD
MKAPAFLEPSHIPEPQFHLSTGTTTLAPAGKLPITVNPVEEITDSALPEPQPAHTRKTLTVKSGENLSLIFDRLNLSRQDLDHIISLGKPAEPLKDLMPGHELRISHLDGQLLGLEYDINFTDTVCINKKDDAFVGEVLTRELVTKVNQAAGIITDSLFLSAQRSGVSDNLTMQLVELFGWDIDFALDIREGDSFLIIFEEKYKDGKKVQDGPILAAEFVNQATPFYAVRYKTTDGYTNYYDEKGFSIRKAFLRTPVNYNRISSLFSLARRHPVLNKIRAHKGVDYAAPSGTPVKSTADGIVAFVGTNGGYGKMIVMRHGEKYSTAYGHLSRYASRISVGKRIQQGQTIGYVGSTGLATGPHLHYEFRINGLHHNPLTVSLPKAMGIPEKEMANFRSESRIMLAQLESAKAAMTQRANPNGNSVAAITEDPEKTRVIK